MKTRRKSAVFLVAFASFLIDALLGGNTAFFERFIQ